MLSLLPLTGTIEAARCAILVGAPVKPVPLQSADRADSLVPVGAAARGVGLQAIAPRTFRNVRVHREFDFMGGIAEGRDAYPFLLQALGLPRGLKGHLEQALALANPQVNDLSPGVGLREGFLKQWVQLGPVILQLSSHLSELKECQKGQICQNHDIYNDMPVSIRSSNDLLEDEYGPFYSWSWVLGTAEVPSQLIINVGLGFKIKTDYQVHW